MEYVDGGNLTRMLRACPRRSAGGPAGRDLARAIHVAHERGIVHRDLNPGNILMAPTARPRSPTSGWPSSWSTTGVSNNGVLLGTPSYMAPEQVSGDARDIGPATDIYALGAILYEMLTGRPRSAA